MARIEDHLDLQQRIRAKISDAYYEARNKRETMEDAASSASAKVMEILVDEGLLADPRREERGAEYY